MGAVATELSETMTQVQSIETIDWRLRALEEDRRRFIAALDSLKPLAGAVEEIRRDLQRGHDQMRDQDGEIDAVSERVYVLELAMPVLKLTSRWVIAGVVGILGLVGMQGYRLVYGL